MALYSSERGFSQTPRNSEETARKKREREEKGWADLKNKIYFTF